MDITKLLENLNEFVSHFKTINEGNATAIIEHVKEIMIPMNIRATYEHLSCLEKAPRFKIILSSNRHKADYNVPLVRQANGLIILFEHDNDNITCRTLVDPINDTSNNFDKTMEEFFSQDLYDIYKIKDGTMFTLYWDGEWLYATKNNVNIYNMKWRGHIYGDIIQDVLKQYPDFDLSKLDKTKSYTIGFKHPAFHPFGQPAEYTNTPDETSKWIKEAWAIKPVEIPGLPAQEVIPKEKLITTKMNKGYLYSALKQCADTLKKYLDGGDPFFGFILRSKDVAKTGKYSDVLLESALWNSIRKSIYQLPYIPNRTLRIKQSQNFKNFTRIIVDSYLNFNKKNLFIKLFPQFQSYYDKLAAAQQYTIDEIYGKLPDRPWRERTTINPTIEKTKINALVNKFQPIVMNQYQLSKGGYRGNRGNRGRRNKRDQRLGDFISNQTVTNDKKIIRTIINNPRYGDTYYDVLFSEN